MYGDRVNTNFQGKKVPKENASYKCICIYMKHFLKALFFNIRFCH